MAKRAAAGPATAAVRPKKTKRPKKASKKAPKKAAAAATAATATAAVVPRASSVSGFHLFIGSLQREPSQQRVQPQPRAASPIAMPSSPPEVMEDRGGDESGDNTGFEAMEEEAAVAKEAARGESKPFLRLVTA
ncbi:hypothetical protein BJ546DRAFT_1079562 [Cryomyces antarcticus]